MLRSWLLTIGLAALLYAALCLFLFITQRSLIYYPIRHTAPHPAAAFELSVDGARVQVLHRAAAGPRAVIYFGGNAEDVAHAVPGLAAHFPHHAIYLMVYRGYGGSTGRPSESVLVGDALALYDHVARRHPRVQVIGRSLGTGVATQLAGRRAVERLVLVTPFKSVLDVAQRQFPFLPVRWLLLDRYESWRVAQTLRTPTLLLAAERDEVIPRASTLALLGHFPDGVARLEVLPGTGHNTIGRHPAYWPRVRGD